MPVDFQWDDDAQTILRFRATPPWNWTDFHRAIRLATFRLASAAHPVEIPIDLREGGKLPAGALGHIRSLGVALHPQSHNRAVIIGLDESIAGPLGGANRTYQDATRLIRFAETDDEAWAILAAWQVET